MDKRVAQICIQKCARMMSLVFGLVACPSPGDKPPGATIVADSEAAVVDPDSAGLRRSRIGLVFDALRARKGDRVGDLVITDISAVVAQADSSTVVGTAAFKGELRLSGRTMRHPDYPEFKPVCFEADSASAARMPRWSGDRRRAWFCFRNNDEAASRLAAPGVERPATIVIDDFTIHRGLSDQVNEARLVSPVRPR